ncbi:DUF3626 domain-containing protein [Pseudobacillus badius]|uniref:DUF3626 domain-containing protein n=1 Tax=Bacillus badius TaxID=1455 RepID=UPI003CE7512E
MCTWRKQAIPSKTNSSFINYSSKRQIYLINKKTYRNFNNYTELKIHEDTLLENDIEMFVLDNSFKDTNIDRTLEKICQEYSLNLY